VHCGRAPLQDALVPFSVVTGHLKAADAWANFVALVFDPANRSALADLIVVLQSIASRDPVARVVVSAAGAGTEAL
jgi:hypothetical protein